MPSWNDVLKEIQDSKRLDALDFVRRKYIKQLYEITGRNVIAYYSGWLQKPGMSITLINDDDKNGFMNAIFGMNRTKGLDLLLHTPGGDLAATESLVNYLHKMFGDNVRAIIPQLAMSAGTMVACACREIVMGKESSIGPIDPQLGGVSAHAVVEEFKRALDEVRADPRTIPIWQVIISKYHPTFIGDCEKAIEWASKMAKDWIQAGMLKDTSNPSLLAERIVKGLSDHSNTKNHSRHIDSKEAEELGLKIISLESGLQDKDFQDCVLTIHHAYMHTFSQSQAYKIVENHEGKALIFSAPQMPPPFNFMPMPQQTEKPQSNN
jgi:hypothetical protein